MTTPDDTTPDPATLRIDYLGGPLRRRDVAADPITQFRRWFDEAVAAGGPGEPTAMVLATVDADGRPASRVVLLKGLDERGFAFYTNARSRKGRHLTANPAVALTFHWPVLHRQVGVRGTVRPLPPEESDAYFAMRPRGARIAAIASPQSEVLAHRAELEARVAEASAAHPGEDIPRPPHWGGFVVAPDEVEFWQGRPDRLHDRLRYRRAEEGWIIERLAP